MRIKYYLLGFLTATIIFIVMVIGYFSGTKNKNVLTKSPQATQKPTDVYTPPTLTPTPKPLSLQDVKDNIAAVLENKNYISLKLFMENTVTLNIEGNNCCGTISAKNALDKLDFLDKSKGPWDFDEQSNIVINLQASYPEDFDNAIVGISRNNYVAAFQLDSENKIVKITLATDYKILLP